MIKQPLNSNALTLTINSCYDLSAIIPQESPRPDLPPAGHVGHDTFWEQQGGCVPVQPTEIQTRLQGVQLG